MQQTLEPIHTQKHPEPIVADVPNPLLKKKEKSSPLGWTFFALMHLACLGVFTVGWSWAAIGVMASLYVLRVFAITGFYHRYFSHRSFKTSRITQFIFAFIGAMSAQQGPLWWAAHHRHHHPYSDKPEDLHSPRQGGFWHSHIAWVVKERNMGTDLSKIRDFAKYPELVWLNNNHLAAPITLAALTALAGYLMQPLGTNPLQMLIWGFFVSTVLLYHATFTINSLSHVFGKQRYKTGDDSRNNWFLAIITMGEGWHNNHHYYMTSTRQGFYWWEYDFTFYILWVMSKLGIIWDMKKVPEHIRARHKTIRP